MQSDRVDNIAHEDSAIARRQVFFKPLSESGSLQLISPVKNQIETHKFQEMHDVLELGLGEERVIHQEVFLAEHAVGTWVQVIDVPATAKVDIRYVAHLDQLAVWKHIIVIRGEGDVNIHRRVNLTGAKSEAELVCVGRGLGQGNMYVSDEVMSLAADTQGKIQTRLSLRDRAKSWIRANMTADRNSYHAQLHERIEQMLLSDHARAAVIPELDVQTDQVRCGHAATTSRPDVKAIFYLLSRGLSEDQALELLETGFLREYLKILPEPIQADAFRVIWR